ncbi:MAG: hypothetical protein ABI589_10555, partial [Burkholderiales bacterium]
MKNDLSSDTAARIKALLERDLALTLPAATESEMREVVFSALTGGGSAGGRPPTERRVTILLADLRGFTAM